MLEPQKNRLDYGEHLIAPEGYHLTSAIATTYSLDLQTLLTLPIAMCFGHTLEGQVEQMRIALLDALGTLKDKLTVFYQQGNIKVPDKYNSLFGLLERSLFPVVPDAGGKQNSAFSSFHPKLWLMRFESETPDSPVRYRLIVLSRNLTFDRSWDLSAVINGEVRNGRKWHNSPLIEFFQQLHNTSGKSSFDEVIDPEELIRVHWFKPDGVQKIAFLPTIFDGVERQRPLELPKQNQSLLAMSPFIRGGSHVDALDWLKGFSTDGKRYLLSRKEELDLAGADALAGWECYAFNEDLVNAEEKEEMESSQFQENDLNLHAKLLVVDETDSTSSWHLGSANMTKAALGDASHAPRNTEFMLRLSGDPQTMGVSLLLQQLTNESNTGLFVKHEFSTQELDGDDTADNRLRQIEHQLMSANWEIIVDQTDDGYTQTLTCKQPLESSYYDLHVSMISVEQRKQLEEIVIWDKLKASQITAFIRFDIASELEVLKQLVIQVPIKFICQLDRERLITSELLQDSTQFMSYISMLLQIQPTKQELLGFEKQHVAGSEGIEIFSKDSVIYEKLMRAAATSPDLLNRIDKLQQQVDEKIIPQQFKQLWSVFSKFLGETSAQ